MSIVRTHAPNAVKWVPNARRSNKCLPVHCKLASGRRGSPAWQLHQPFRRPRAVRSANLGTITNLQYGISRMLDSNVLAGVRVHDDGRHWLWPAVQSATIRQRRPPRCPRVGAPPWLRLRLPSNSCWSSSRSGSRALGRRHRRNRRVRATPNTRRVGAYSRSGWSSSGRRRAAARQQQRQRDRSSGRDDVSGCSRPCLIAYYDLASFRYDRLLFLAQAKASQS